MDTKRTPYEALMACHDAAGSGSQLARDLGTNQPRISRIINSVKRLPPEFVLKAELLYGVPRHELAPDIYPRGLVEGQPFVPDDVVEDEFSPITFKRSVAVDQRQSSRFRGVDRRAGARV
jgi:DNA-binding transcriptional regulator YdaS (Cro superfamily)